VCPRTATTSPWCVTNQQMHEDMEVPFTADHIRALTNSFASKLGDEGKTLVRQLERRSCRPKADHRCLGPQPKANGNQQATETVDTGNCLVLASYSSWDFAFQSFARWIPGIIKRRGIARNSTTPNSRSVSSKITTPYVTKAFGLGERTRYGFKSLTSSQHTSLWST